MAPKKITHDAANSAAAKKSPAAKKSATPKKSPAAKKSATPKKSPAAKKSASSVGKHPTSAVGASLKPVIGASNVMITSSKACQVFLSRTYAASSS